MERTLVEQARDGDHDAFAELATRSGARLFAVATLILRDQEAAKDAVQDALIAAWRGIRALRDPEAWEAWLHRLLVRACYRLGRRRGNFVELGSGEMGEAVAGDDFAVPVADRDQLDRGFVRLPTDQRAILVLHYYLDMPLSETAKVLGIPEGTAKSRLHRAIRAMRVSLEPGALDDRVVVEELTP